MLCLIPDFPPHSILTRNLAFFYYERFLSRRYQEMASLSPHLTSRCLSEAHLFPYSFLRELTAADH